ncbi:globin domain-containing protein [Alisedimentitalea sp. MJ-SS2]|uniref:globin domain-containing protein n=1 Tax=Aliisedimentitalea sp. MJ-SS2 TaxID=3049795 RepID=UPI002909EE73|nr:globin domain-containing protein [Alisedimentitalea sp. MJ-SS2]MDU8928081.1 globin domain-containing protein [Alisedimentitalea sp. MJ-SS2]
MPLDQNQLDLIRQSFAALKENPERRSHEFYEAFFDRAPEVKPMFREDIEGQGMRFLATLSMIVGHLDQPEKMAERLEELGQGHRAMGVTQAQFAPMGEALVATLAAALGDDFTPETRAAWEAGFAEITASVVEKGGIGQV